LKIYTTFKDVQMILKRFYDISTGFRFSKNQCECSVHSCSCPCVALCLLAYSTHIYIWHSWAQARKWPRFCGSNVYVIQLNRDWHNKATSFISSKSCHAILLQHRQDWMPFLLLLNTAPHEWEVDGVAWCWYVNKLYTNIHPVGANSKNVTTLFHSFSMKNTF
jgi:hypothetical protein